LDKDITYFPVTQFVVERFQTTAPCTHVITKSCDFRNSHKQTGIIVFTNRASLVRQQCNI